MLGLKACKRPKVVTVALANKIARIARALLRHNEDYSACLPWE
jgi:transposase